MKLFPGQRFFWRIGVSSLAMATADYVDMVVDAYEASGGTDRVQVNDWVKSAWKKAQDSPLAMPRTFIDDMADKKHAQMVANRLANARLSGSTSQLIAPSSFVDWTETPVAAPYWIHGMIPQGEQVVVYGKPEAGKTFLAIDWAMSVASGRRSWGRQVTQGRVWFCAGEGNARITSRMHAWMQHHRVTPDLQQMKLLNHVPDLMNDQVIEAMAQKIAEEEVDVVILDTLGRAMAVGGGDISEPRDAAQALRSLQNLSKYRLSTTPIAIHHPVKDGGMAGAYNLLAGVDVVLKAEADDGYGTLKFAKNKDGEKTKICEYEWRPVGPSAVLVPAHGD
jgi:RecA-family ATPase